jgi:hypothetical protein
MRGRLPGTITRRRAKIGFETPQRAWVRGPLAAVLTVLADDTAAPIWSVADREAAASMIRATVAGKGTGDISDMVMRLWFADVWLRGLVRSRAV